MGRLAIRLAAIQRRVLGVLIEKSMTTPGELKGNASRMTPLEDLHYVAELLAALASRDPPLVLELPRQPGRSVSRFDHRMYPDDEAPAVAPVALVEDSAERGRGRPGSQAADGLQERVERLEAETAALREAVEGLRARLAGAES